MCVCLLVNTFIRNQMVRYFNICSQMFSGIIFIQGIEKGLSSGFCVRWLSTLVIKLATWTDKTADCSNKGSFAHHGRSDERVRGCD